MVGNLDDELLKQRNQAILDQYRDSNNAMIDFSKMALRGTMLLNGAAVIPIVYSKSSGLYECAIFFGVGALLSACASGTAYLTQWAITGEFSPAFHMNAKTEAEVAASKKAERLARRCRPLEKISRYLSIALVVASLVAFGCGLSTAYTATKEMNKMPELKVYLEGAAKP